MTNGIDRVLKDDECSDLLAACLNPTDSMQFKIGDFVQVFSTLYPKKKKLIVQMEIAIDNEDEPASLGDVTISPLQIYRFITGK